MESDMDFYSQYTKPQLKRTKNGRIIAIQRSHDHRSIHPVGPWARWVIGMSSGSVGIDSVYRQALGLKRRISRISGSRAALLMRRDVAVRDLRSQEFTSACTGAASDRCLACPSLRASIISACMDAASGRFLACPSWKTPSAAARLANATKRLPVACLRALPAKLMM